MQKVSVWSIAIPLILLSLGFIFIGAIGYAMSPEWLSAQQIQDQARKSIPEPTYPPPLAGKQVVTQSTRQVCTQVPRVNGGFPPKITMQDVCSSVPDPTVTVTGPSTDETKEWQNKVASMRSAHELAVGQEAARISERQRSDLKSYVKDMIQISTGILGLITGIAALIIGAIKGTVPKIRKDGEDAEGGEEKLEGAE